VSQISLMDFVLRKGANGSLGPLESEVLELLQRCGSSSVRDVQNRMSRKLAYTTVMTTLDRLYKKGFLVRTKSNRSFHYDLSHARWGANGEDSSDLLAEQLHFLSGAQLISCLIDVVATKDAVLLEQLEHMAAARRMELNRKRAQ
jgi:predicted transcriptional regulator